MRDAKIFSHLDRAKSSLPWLMGEGITPVKKILRNIFVKNLNFLLCRGLRVKGILLKNHNFEIFLLFSGHKGLSRVLKVEGKIKILKNISI